MSMLVIIGVITYTVLAPDGAALVAPPLWLVGAQLVAGLAIHLVLDAVGYRVPAVRPGTPTDEAQRTGVAAYTSRTVLRLALSESVALASLALVFVLGGHQWLGYVSGAVVSLVLLAVHVWPWSRPIDRTLAGLQLDGARVPLREAFGLEPELTGPIQEL
jgi:hypothetical protein